MLIVAPSEIEYTNRSRRNEQHAQRNQSSAMRSLSELIELACLMEASARKPGNVHPGAAFVDLCYDDFVKGAAAIAPVLAQNARHGVGKTVLMAIEATQQQVSSNINLGIVLLLTPLAAVSRKESLFDGVPGVLARTSQQDAADVYRAIRLAHPGGLGKVDDQDVAESPTQTLVEVMRLAADRDLIAAQYATDFALVQSLSAGMAGMLVGARIGERRHPQLPHATPSGPPLPLWEWLVVAMFIDLLAKVADSLIVRKVGQSEARQVGTLAAEVVRAKWPFNPASWLAFRDLDDWLRADGHRRNPGTCADLMAATIFVLLREGWFEPPSKEELQIHAAAIRVA